eukprot:gene7416-8199_t
MSSLLKSVVNTVSRSYKGLVATKLKAAGLKYNDLLVESDDVVTALSRVSPQVLVERERRIRRAIDASAKKKTMPEEVQNYNPFDLYLAKQVRLAKFERTERAIFDA